MNWQTLKVLVIDIIAFCVVFFLLSTWASSADRLRIGVSSFTPINAALWIGEEKGLFKKYGIDSEVILIGGHICRRRQLVDRR